MKQRTTWNVPQCGTKITNCTLFCWYFDFITVLRVCTNISINLISCCSQSEHKLMSNYTFINFCHGSALLSRSRTSAYCHCVPGQGASAIACLNEMCEWVSGAVRRGSWRRLAATFPSVYPRAAVHEHERREWKNNGLYWSRVWKVVKLVLNNSNVLLLLWWYVLNMTTILIKLCINVLPLTW